MMQGVVNIATMNKELLARAEAGQLNFQCGADGNFNADTAIIAEAPGEREVAMKIPLCGASGRVLWENLRKEGIGRHNTYNTNVVKRQLPTIQTKKAVIQKQELSQWIEILHEELSFLPNLRYVIALGNYALQTLTQQIGITHWRGSVIETTFRGRPLDIVCTFNPAHIIREPKNEVVFRFDLNKFTRVRKGEYKRVIIDEIIHPSFNEAMEFIDECRNDNVPISYDIETLNGSTACIGLANKNNTGMCIAFHNGYSNYFSFEQERKLRINLQRLFDKKETRFVAQNGNFDATWLWYMDKLRVHRNWFDTMLAHHVLYPSLPHNLGFITSQYVDHPYYKDDGKQWRQINNIEAFWRYNVKDVCITRMAQEKLLEELQQQGMDKFFFEHVMMLQPSLVRMTVGGVKCDVDLKEKITNELITGVEQARDLCQKAAQEATGNPNYAFNPRSPRDLSNLFFTDLKLVGRGSSTDKENRDRMRKHPRTTEAARNLISRIDDYLGEAKFLSTYAGTTIDADGRFRCEYRQIGVQSAPGRLSSSATMWGNGLNMQNIPERAKPMMVADEGYEFSYFDMAQIEARFVACFAKIERWLEQYELARLNPGVYDAHCALASDMFKVPYDEVPKHDTNPDGTRTIRFIAKRCRHGLNYRMAPDRLATTTGLSIHEAEVAYNIYHRETPELRAWWDDLAAEVRNTRQLVSPLGRRWLLLERFDETALDSIVAFKPQSTAGDWVCGVIYKCENDPRWPRDARICLNIHDALIALNRIDDGPLVRSIMREYAEQPIHINGYDMIVPAEFGVSKPDEFGVHRWSTITKIKI